MGAVLHCLIRFCCNGDDDESETSRYRTSHVQYSVTTPVQNSPMTRSGDVRHIGVVRAGSYQTASSTDQSDTEDALLRSDCWLASTAGSSVVPDVASAQILKKDTSCSEPYLSNPHTASIHEFFRRLRERWRKYDSLVPVRDGAIESDHGSSFFRNASCFGGPASGRGADQNTQKPLISKSPLRPAASFESSRGILTIPPEEVVLPGSLLQQEMAKTMSLSLEKQDDECVICMEGFDPTNPRMPTKCGCGTNKTYFHLPCLYQWVEQSEDCPSCRQKLSWVEF